LKKLADKIRRVGLIANTAKAASPAILNRAARLVAASGHKVLTDTATARIGRLKCPALPDVARLAKDTDLLLVFGGDGTMLRAAREVAGSNTPILGINIGGMGFLTAVSSEQLDVALKQVWAGYFELEPRPLITVKGTVGGRPVAERALNDFVIGRGAGSRLIELEVKVDGEVLTNYRCDGLIVSSPTGSTAYSLAAGGAIVSPVADVFTLTPICPHTLSNRSVILSLGSVLEVKALSERLETMLSADGEIIGQIHPGEVVTITRSKNSVRLVRLHGSSFFQTLRQKLSWSGSNV
jgi:NAD+ kinase